MNIFHITHTDIRSDNRILKVLSALSEVDSYQLHGTGVALDEGAAATEQAHQFSIRSIDLWTGGFRWLPRPLRYTLMMIELTVRLWKEGLQLRPSVVHCHDTLVLPAGLLIKLFSKARLVYDAHELESNKNGQTLILSKATLILEKICWRSVDLLISVSPSIIQWYEDNLGRKQNALILNSPLIAESESTALGHEVGAGDYFRNRYGIPSTCLVFVYLGLLVQGRGIENIVSAFRDKGLNSHVVFVGYGDMSHRIGEIASDESNIHLHEPVPHEKVVPLVRNADVGLCLIENVSLSDYYCLPNKLFEYVFAGIPILGSKFPDIQQTVDNYGLGYCCDNDTQSIAETVKLIESEGHPGRVDVDLTELSWQAQAQRLVHAYTGVLNNE